MGGGLLQLVAYGAQDVYLTGNPQITFFKVVYRRHTNFAIEAIQQTPTGSNSLGSRASFQITRNGDLIHRVYFNAKLKNTNTSSDVTALKKQNLALVPNFGQKLLKSVELEIGGQRIDKHYSEWLYIWNELSLPVGKTDGYHNMVGANSVNLCTKLGPDKEYEVYVPLEFWFCRNVGLALPLIALQYHEVKINVEYESQAKLIDTGEFNLTAEETLTTTRTGATANTFCSNGNKLLPSATATAAPYTIDVSGQATAFEVYSQDESKLKLIDANLWVDYIFLDTDERRRFAQLSHEYLIEQLQFTGTDTLTGSTNPDSMKSVRLNFNHPCKELVWVINDDDAFWNNFSDNKVNTTASQDDSFFNNNYDISSNPVHKAKIMLNGNDRFAARSGDYFSVVQPYQHHENTPNQQHSGINVYSFALKPEEHQPSGTLNMSRIDTAVLQISSSVSGTIHVYALSYNVLRILSGMGGLAYSN